MFNFDAGEFADYIAAGGNFYDGIASNIRSIVNARAAALTYGYADKLTAYFDPNYFRGESTSRLLADLFHEALHGFGDNRQAKYGSTVNKTYSDRRLQQAFGLPQQADNTVNISK
jgi:hypothetical protein